MFSEFCNVIVKKKKFGGLINVISIANLSLLPDYRISSHWGGPTTQAQSVKMWKASL